MNAFDSFGFYFFGPYFLVGKEKIRAGNWECCQIEIIKVSESLGVGWRRKSKTHAESFGLVFKHWQTPGIVGSGLEKL